MKSFGLTVTGLNTTVICTHFSVGLCFPNHVLSDGQNRYSCPLFDYLSELYTRNWLDLLHVRSSDHRSSVLFCLRRIFGILKALEDEVRELPT